MRTLKSLAVLALLGLLGAAGAVIAMDVTGPAAAGRPGAATSGRPGAAATLPPVQVTRGVDTRTVRAGQVHRAPVRLIVRNPAGRTLVAATLGALSPTRVPGGYAPIDPPVWNQPVWVRYRPLVPPDDTAHGTSYVYGHACHHHVCAFTRLHRVQPGATVSVKAGAHTTRYVVTRTSADFPKTGPHSLAHRTTGVADRGIRNRLVLITCAYEHGDVSLNNFLVVAVRQPRSNDRPPPRVRPHHA